MGCASVKTYGILENVLKRNMSNITKEQRRIRYNFLRYIGYSRKDAQRIRDYPARKYNMVCLGRKDNMVCLGLIEE